MRTNWSSAAACKLHHIFFAIGVLSCYSQSPCPSHWDAALGTLRYCLFTVSRALTYGATQSGTMVAAQIYHDSDFTSSQGCRRSKFGCSCPKQCSCNMGLQAKETEVLSTMEAEYQSASFCRREVVWLRKLWPQLSFPVAVPPVYGDDKACLALCASQQIAPMS